jgi:predicted amidophosphoribosyltransferase
LKVSLKKIVGPWDQGWVLDKHTLSSICIGHVNGHPQFDTTRSEVGEATFQLKYRQDWKQVNPLAQALVDNIYPKFKSVGFIVPMPASTVRKRQPVTAVAETLGAIVKIPVFTDLLRKTPGGKSLKDMSLKTEKLAAIGDSFSINDEIEGNGPWNVLVVDDLFDTGASMETACKMLRKYKKVSKIYVAALTWK